MRQRAARHLYILLGLYVGVSLAYLLSGSVSLIVGYWDFRHQVTSPFEVDRMKVTEVSQAAKDSGLKPGDTVESINGTPVRGRAAVLAFRWYARPGEVMQVGVRHPDGTRASFPVPLVAFPKRDIPLREAVFIVFLQIVLPLACLVAGYWVALARPTDPNAWLILVLLSYPNVFITVSTFNWWPGLWLVLRLYWHLTLQVVAIGALLVLGLRFPERSRIDRRAPWLKYVVLTILAGALVLEWLAEYSNWYDREFLPGVARLEGSFDVWLQRLMVVCVLIYFVSVVDQFRTTIAADARRRVRVLLFGSLFGLGNTLVIWGVLPLLGIYPGKNQAVAYTSAILFLAFPFSLAYVVIVQRALDVSILIRMGTRYLLARASLLILQFGLIFLLLFQYVIPVMRRHQEYGLSMILPIVIVAIVLRANFVRRSPADRARDWLDRRFFREQYNAEQVLGELAERVRRVTDPAALIELVSSRISEVMHIPQMAVMLRNGNGFAVSSGGTITLPEGSRSVRHLIETSSPAVLYRDEPAEWFREAEFAERRALDELHAQVLIPLPGRDRLMGLMVLGPKRSEEPYSPTDLRLLQWVAVQAGMGLEISDLAQSLAHEAARHQLIQRELEIAHEVQERLFPQTIPAVPGTDLAGHCRPALGVGGDYYDMIEFEDGRLALAIGDVSGKGIPAALLMASLRASLRGMTADGAHDLAHLMRKLNRLVYESSAVNRYATFFFAIFDPPSGQLRYVNGGHNPPMVVRADEVLKLDAGRPVIGLLRDVEFEEQCVQLRPGDVFVGYTDGISEAMTVDDEEWGEERMLSEVRPYLDAAGMLRHLMEAADRFTAGAPQHDDMTLLIMKLRAGKSS